MLIGNTLKQKLDTTLIYRESVVTNYTKFKNILNNIKNGDYNFTIVLIITILVGILVMIIIYNCF